MTLREIDQAIAANPINPRALYDRAAALVNLGRGAEAITVLDLALTMAPTSEPLWITRSAALIQLGRLHEAIVACDRVLETMPGSVDALLNKGAALIHLKRPKDALVCLNQALEGGNNTNIPHVLANRAAALHVLNRHYEAIQDYRELLDINPMMPVVRSSMIACLDFIHTDGFELLQKERREYNRLYAAETPLLPITNDRNPDRPLRVGYVSADFHFHSAAFAVVGIIEHHPYDEFEVAIYSNDHHAHDAMTTRFKARADIFRNIMGLTDEEFARQVQEDKIDILVDLSGHSVGNRLLAFAYKPAPIQISAWGHAGGTGLDAMDYHFADPIAIPQEVRHLFAEEIIDLPCLITYEPPPQIPKVRPSPFRRNGFVRFGSLNRYHKVTRDTERVWAQIVNSVPNSELFLKDSLFDDEAERLEVFRRYQKLHVNPQKILFMGSSPHLDHLRSFGEVDICLDPWPMGGGVTTWESLWMGTPVICRTGKTLCSLLSPSINTAIGLPGLVAESEEEYIAAAVGLASDRELLAYFRGTLRERLKKSVAADSQQYAFEVEKTYRKLWKRWCVTGTPRSVGG